MQQGDAIPGKGLRPTLPEEAAGGVALAAVPEYLSMEGIDFDDKDQNRNKQEVWLVELPAIYESTLIVPAWRDLRGRFPQLMTNHRLWPRLQGRVADGDTDRASWYRLFVAEFSKSKEAEAFCNGLTGIRCRVVSSKSGDFCEGVAVAPKSRQKPESKKTASSPSKHEAKPATANMEAALMPPVKQDLPETAASIQAAPASSPVTTPQSSVGAETGNASMGEAAAASIPDTADNSATAESYGENMSLPVASVEHVTRLGYAVQLGTFRTFAKANISVSAWEAKGYLPYVYKTEEVNGRSWFTVRVGKFSERTAASALAMSIRQKVKVQAMPVPVMFDAGTPNSDNSSVDSAQRGSD